MTNISFKRLSIKNEQPFCFPGPSSRLQRGPGRNEPDPSRARVDSSPGSLCPPFGLRKAHSGTGRRHNVVASAHGGGRGQHPAQQLQAQHRQGRLQGQDERQRVRGLHERREPGGLGRADRGDLAGGRGDGGGEKR